MSKPFRILVTAFAALVGYYAVQRVMDSGSSLDALATGLRTHLERQGDWAEYQSRLNSTTNPAERQRLSMELARHGIARLSPDDMAERARLLLHLDSIADVAQCAQRFMGTLDADGMKAYLGRLEPAEFDRWAEISAHAVGAELHATTPIAAATAEEIGLAFSNAKRPMSTPDENHFNSVMGNVQAATPEDLCWTSKFLMGTTLALPEPPRGSVLATFAKLEAGLQ